MQIMHILIDPIKEALIIGDPFYFKYKVTLIDILCKLVNVLLVDWFDVLEVTFNCLECLFVVEEDVLNVMGGMVRWSISGFRLFSARCSCTGFMSVKVCSWWVHYRSITCCMSLLRKCCLSEGMWMLLSRVIDKLIESIEIEYLKGYRCISFFYKMDHD